MHIRNIARKYRVTQNLVKQAVEATGVGCLEGEVAPEDMKRVGHWLFNKFVKEVSFEDYLLHHLHTPVDQMEGKERAKRGTVKIKGLKGTEVHTDTLPTVQTEVQTEVKTMPDPCCCGACKVDIPENDKGPDFSPAQFDLDMSKVANTIEGLRNGGSTEWELSVWVKYLQGIAGYVRSTPTWDRKRKEFIEGEDYQKIVQLTNERQGNK